MLRAVLVWKAPAERTKIAFYRDLSVAILESLLRLPPLIGALVLIDQRIRKSNT